MRCNSFGFQGRGAICLSGGSLWGAAGGASRAEVAVRRIRAQYVLSGGSLRRDAKCGPKAGRSCGPPIPRRIEDVATGPHPSGAACDERPREAALRRGAGCHCCAMTETTRSPAAAGRQEPFGDLAVRRMGRRRTARTACDLFSARRAAAAPLLSIRTESR